MERGTGGRGRLRATLAALGSALAVAGPGQAQAQQAPPPLPEHYVLATPGTVSAQPWWESFEDPSLRALIRQALGANGDVRAAWARVEQADALARQALASLLPSLTGSANVNLAPTETLGFQFGGLPSQPGQPAPPALFGTGAAQLQLAYELDLAGRRLVGWHASRFDVEASRGDADALALALSTRVAEAWFDMAATAARLELLQHQLQANEQLLELLELRFRQGASTALDVLQQRQQVASTATLLPQSRARLALARQQLATLVAQPLGTPLPQPAAAVPALAPLPASGVPAHLLEHRPDLRAAAARAEAARARTSSTVRALFPSLRLTAQAGVQGFQLTELRTQRFWGAGATLNVPLFAGGAEYAAISQSQAAESAAEAGFRQSVLLAAQEVQGLLIREQEQREQISAQERQVEAAQLAYEESKARYVAGLANYVQVLTATTAWQLAQLNLLQARRDWLSLRIQLHAALGGAWTEGLSAPQPEESRR